MWEGKTSVNQNAFDLEAEMPHGLELYFQMQRTYPSRAYLKTTESSEESCVYIAHATRRNTSLTLE